MRALLVCLLVSFGIGQAAARTGPDDPFDSAVLSYEELRVVQASLVFSGWYDGLLDGEWGAASQAALDAYASAAYGANSPLFGHLIPILTTFQEEWTGQNWHMKYVSETGTSFALPRALLTQDDPDTLDWLSRDGTLAARLGFASRDETQAQHEQVYSQRDPEKDPFVDTTPDLFVTVVALPDDRIVYLRSDRIKGRFVTLSLEGSRAQKARLGLMAASAARGSMPGLKSPSGGVLAGLEGQAFAGLRIGPQTGPQTGPQSGKQDRVPDPGPEPDPQLVPGTDEDAGIDGLGRLGRGRDGTGAPGRTAGGPDVPGSALDPGAPRTKPGRKVLSPDDSTSTGSGFYVHPQTIVTAAHVVEGCRAMSLLDGTELAVVAADDALDVAVLTAPQASLTWLVVSADVRPRLGETVYALGYPYLGLLNQGLSVTGGNISALGGIDPSEARIMVSAPVQPGNSGGPLINAKGEVIGVVVSRIDDMNIFDQTGSLPQNMNFAVPPEPLVAFLDDALVDFPGGAREPIDIARGLPDDMRDAVVPLYCY